MAEKDREQLAQNPEFIVPGEHLGERLERADQAAALEQFHARRTAGAEEAPTTQAQTEKAASGSVDRITNDETRTPDIVDKVLKHGSNPQLIADEINAQKVDPHDVMESILREIEGK